MKTRWIVLVGLATPMPAFAHPPACPEVTAVVGRSTCSPFGASWASPSWMPSVFVELGVIARRTHVVSPSVVLPDGSIGRSIAAEPSPLDTIGTEMRFGIDHSGHLYTATHLDAGFGSADGVIAVGLVVGTRVSHGRLAAGAEVVGGWRWYLLGRLYDSAEHESGYSDVVGGALLDARIRGDAWIAPWLSIGAWVGTSVVDRGDTSAGITFGISTRTFRGR